MINKVQAQKFCGEDISLIENYEEAVNDKINMWDCHHIWGTMLGYTRQELKELDEYYGIPACNLIFLTKSEHRKLHHKGKKVSEETRKKMSEYQKGKKYSEETRKKMSESQKGRYVSEETRKKMSEYQINNVKLSKPILQFTKYGEFVAEYPSLNECSRQLGISHGNICMVLKHKRKSAGGFIFKYKY